MYDRNPNYTWKSWHVWIFTKETLMIHWYKCYNVSFVIKFKEKSYWFNSGFYRVLFVSRWWWKNADSKIDRRKHNIRKSCRIDFWVFTRWRRQWFWFISYCIRHYNKTNIMRPWINSVSNTMPYSRLIVKAKEIQTQWSLYFYFSLFSYRRCNNSLNNWVEWVYRQSFQNEV